MSIAGRLLSSSFASRTSAQVARAAFALVFVVIGAVDARATSVVTIERTVLGASFVEAAEVYQASDQEGFRSDRTGSFVHAAVGGSGFGDVTNAFFEATQDTVIALAPNGFHLGGSGAAGVEFDVNDAGFPSRGQASANSAIALVFEVTEPSEFSLAVSLSAALSRLEILSGEGPVESSLRAFARLSGAESGWLLDFFASDSTDDGVGDAQSRVLSGVLAPDTYLLEIEASAFQRGFEDAVGQGLAGFAVELVVAPEPSSSVLLGLGLLGLSLSSGRAPAGARA